MKVKNEIRIIGWDDSSFSQGSKGNVNLVGVVFRGGKFMDGVLITQAEIDGSDATQAIATRVNKSRHKDQLRLIMTDGITMAGFNYVNIKSLGKKTRLPVIAVLRKKTDMESFMQAARRVKKYRGIMKAVKDAGEFKEAPAMGKKIYFQSNGIEDNDARKAIEISCTRGLVPEPLRVAHLIATAMARGESIGRA